MNSEKAKNWRAGLDLGSTTAKLIIINEDEKILYQDYRRHQTEIYSTVISMLKTALERFNELTLDLMVTGSSAMGLAKKFHIKFVNEVVAAHYYIRKNYPGVRTVYDVGGEDSKIIYIDNDGSSKHRMNGSCAGGTGSFIDQMVQIMGISGLVEFDDLAGRADAYYEMSSRCGVFGKTDIHNFLSRDLPRENICASVYRAVSDQVINSLSRGMKQRPIVLLSGGPFTFLPTFRKIFLALIRPELEKNNDRGFDVENFVQSAENTEYFSALGAASFEAERTVVLVTELIDNLQDRLSSHHSKDHLAPLFESHEEYRSWRDTRFSHRVKRIPLLEIHGRDCYIGIDSGSTTTKIAVINHSGDLVYDFYAPNTAYPIETVLHGLQKFRDLCLAQESVPRIARTAVTGYGENLIQSAFGIDSGMVETIAHFTAARHFNKDVSFILDIGGQDMKAVFIRNGMIKRIELNESCSSGCGSFIDTFSKMQGYSTAQFAHFACISREPCNLGTRCTVFMNSKVKQMQNNDASVSDIAAGLSISVIKNALFKVLKLKNVAELGEVIVAQGGVFRNQSIHRALEVLTGKKIVCSDIPEQMGAYGAALRARSEYRENESSFIGLENLSIALEIQKSTFRCNGCENKCQIYKHEFANHSIYYSGNKCESHYTNHSYAGRKGNNLPRAKLSLIFERDESASNIELNIGIPRILNLFENFPFWRTLFESVGMRVTLSSPSTAELNRKGIGTVASDNICFPTKIANGHIIDLIEKHVDRIFYPHVVYELNETRNAINCFNCPIVSGYPDVVNCSIDLRSYNIPLDKLDINFNDRALLHDACWNYLQTLGVEKRAFESAFDSALAVRTKIKSELQKRGQKIIEEARANHRILIMLLGRPYHLDPFINHKIPEALANMGVDIITEDAIDPAFADLAESGMITQWGYPNRLLNAAFWVAKQSNLVQVLQINSFGCGPDAIVIDEIDDILKRYGKNNTVIRVDDSVSPGSINLRLRSLIESIPGRDDSITLTAKPILALPIFSREDKQRKQIIAPSFSHFYDPYLTAIFRKRGYTILTLPESDEASIELGKKYSNNEICYPATVVIGDIIKALQSGDYSVPEIAVGITQTGGQCRATNYITLLRKAMDSAGFRQIPIISVNTHKLFKKRLQKTQPGFQMNWLRDRNLIIASLLYADSLAKLYYQTISKASNKDDVRIALDQFTSRASTHIENNDDKAIYAELAQASEYFNMIDRNTEKNPKKIGIVGEIYVKYNSFGNRNIVDWLIERDKEVIVPPLTDFFMQTFVNTKVNRAKHIHKNSHFGKITELLESGIQDKIHKVNEICSEHFSGFLPFHDIHELAEQAEKVLSLTNQFGETWLIPAEIMQFDRDGVNTVICLQPFGCIACQITRGVEPRLNTLCPRMNILNVDLDADVTENNLANRLDLLLASK